MNSRIRQVTVQGTLVSVTFKDGDKEKTISRHVLGYNEMKKSDKREIWHWIAELPKEDYKKGLLSRIFKR